MFKIINIKTNLCSPRNPRFKLFDNNIIRRIGRFGGTGFAWNMLKHSCKYAVHTTNAYGNLGALIFRFHRPNY
jgi:hypothetical protein